MSGMEKVRIHLCGVSEEIRKAAECLEEKLQAEFRPDGVAVRGIGEAKASAILEYRRENGDFTYPDELLNVPGIGESIQNNIKDFVYVAPAISENETTE